MSRFYESLIKERKKAKPNSSIVNMYLNKEFISRRNWLECTPAEYRVEKFLETYPCFQNHAEVSNIIFTVIQTRTGAKQCHPLN